MYSNVHCVCVRMRRALSLLLLLLYSLLYYSPLAQTSPGSVAACFTHDDGGFDYVFNCAGETKYGQSDEVYKEKVTDLTLLCAKQVRRPEQRERAREPLVTACLRFSLFPPLVSIVRRPPRA